MSQPTRMGLSLPVPGDPRASAEYAAWAEGEGFDGVWIAEAGDGDALTLAAALAPGTERLRVGTAVVPVYPRTPAVLAASTATIAAFAPGRFVLGLGASSHAMVEGWHGLAYDKPRTRVRETAQLVRRMLAGERVSFDGRTLHSHGFRLSPAPPAPVPIYLAGLLPRMLEMAGEHGDGVVLNLFPLAALPQMLEHVRTGAERSGRRLEDLEIVCRHQVCVTDDPAGARDLVRRRFAPYFATPVYNRFLDWFGYPDQARQIAEGWQARDRSRTQGALDDALVDEIAVIGDAEACREQIRRFVAGGITTPVIATFATDPRTYRATMEAFAPARFF